MGRGDESVDSMIGELPTAYAVALRLEASGADHSAIAVALGIDVDSVGAVLEVGWRKLDEIRQGRARR